MIDITRFNEMLLELQAEVNSNIDASTLTYKNGYWVYDPINASNDGTNDGKGIDHIILSPTESHIVKKLSDKKGICLAVKLADADSNIESTDNYSEQNHQLFFIIEKCNPGDFTDQTEREHYQKLQIVMRLVKEYLKQIGLNGMDCGGDETLSKPFHTEWEYQTYGGFNGLSISFDLQDFRL